MECAALVVGLMIEKIRASTVIYCFLVAQAMCSLLIFTARREVNEHYDVRIRVVLLYVSGQCLKENEEKAYASRRHNVSICTHK